MLPGGGGPAVTQSTWAFFFDFSATNGDVTTTGSSKGSFFTAPSSAGSTGIIGGLQARNIAITVTTKGASRPQQLTIHVGAPISFTSYYANTLKAAISVLESNDPSCPIGSTGTLTVSTEPSIRLDICKGTLLQGTQTTTAHILST